MSADTRRQAIERNRWVWFPGLLVVAAGISFALGPFGLVLIAPQALGLIAVLAAEASRPLLAHSGRDRLLLPILFLVTLGPVLAIACILVVFGLLPGEQEFNLEFRGLDALATLIAFQVPLAAGFLLLAILTLRVRGRRWEARLATWSFPAAAALTVLSQWAVSWEKSQISDPGALVPSVMVFLTVGLLYLVALPAVVALFAYFFRILFPRRMAKVEASVELREGPTFAPYRR